MEQPKKETVSSKQAPIFAPLPKPVMPVVATHVASVTSEKVAEVSYTKAEASAVLRSALVQTPLAPTPSAAASVVPPVAPVAEETPMVTVASPEVFEKVLYQATCATCEQSIEVPFKPDGNRPTFCKDCLRDYQRATAKAKNELARQVTPEPPRKSAHRTTSQTAPDRRISPRTYVSSEVPMSLAQAQHIEPKKFKTLRGRPAINLSEVRALIDDTHQLE